MTDPKRDPDLDDFFAAARAEVPEPSGDLLARIEAQALAERPVARAVRGPGPLRQLLQALGGWPGAAGLAAASAAGLWVGLGLTGAETLWSLVPLETASLGALGLDPLSGFDLAMMVDG
ncbi:MAG: hypothetical protein QNJ09_08905 [Paracoccaceae bacterium]|nr:hypothetical protein [Paracoccaceae bacterium]